MKVIINSDEKSATDKNGNIYLINGVDIKVPENNTSRFYELEDIFSKNVLAKGTEHKYTILKNNKINIH